MVLSHPFNCPTHVVEGHPFDTAAAALIGDRPWALITSPTWIKANGPTAIAAHCRLPKSVLDDVPPNPTISKVFQLEKRCPDVDVLVALGGGSVIDTAKGVAALGACEDGQKALLDHLRQGTPLSMREKPIPIIAIPTTSGTGSEVTRWGTIWGDSGIKYSVNDPHLYPRHAVIDPNLCLKMPRELTLATGLDALSHALEAVWNHHHSTVSDALACQAIAMIRKRLGRVLRSPADLDARRDMHTASTVAGLAMGTTQTALAHAISYPFTSQYGMPHGLACSFTLPEIARFNGERKPNRMAPIAAGLGVGVNEIPDHLEKWFLELRLMEHVSRYVYPGATDQFDDQLFLRARAENNIRHVDGETAKAIAEKALSMFADDTTAKINKIESDECREASVKLPAASF